MTDRQQEVMMNQEYLSATETAELLQVSTGYIKQLVAKQRLHPSANNTFAAQEVKQLAELMAKLRNQGIATLVAIADQT
jgi:hypothetical protein